MISIQDVTVAFGAWKLLDGLSFHIGDNEKIGLVGKNGAGKSTLMKLITGEQAPSSGRVEVPPGVKVGYLPQLMSLSHGRTVMEETLTAFSALHEREREVERLSEQLSSRTDYESEEYTALATRLAELGDHLSLASGEPPRVQAERTLKGLGFRESDFDRPAAEMSQGWNMRIALAKILLEAPDVLLLDEPTNHLDIESIEWFETYLKGFRGAVLLVSHDRRFLDNVTSRTVEIMLGHIHDYKVPYSHYLELRKERMAQQVAAWENQQRMIEKTEDFINRFRYKPTKSNQVQSRIKALERLERVEVEIEDRSALHLRFPPAPRSGDVAFRAVGLAAGYDGKIVFKDADIEIRRGEKVALVGRNGEGKTTLMRVLMGQLAPMAGSAALGHHVQPGYFAQNQEDVLDGSLTVFETLDRIAVGDVRTRLRDILGQFLFKGEDIDKRVGVLSGGERARLGMAKLMLQPYNLLALDEPTNHMDIRSKDVLKQALKQYDGTLVAVSHDRDFLDGLVDKIYWIRDGKVKECLGGVQDFLDAVRMEDLRELERGTAAAGPASTRPAAVKEAKSAPKAEAVPSGRENGGKEDYDARKARSREERRQRQRLERLEAEIAALEGKMRALEAVLGNPGENDDIMELTRSYLEHKRETDRLTEEWTSLAEKMETNNN